MAHRIALDEQALGFPLSDLASRALGEVLIISGEEADHARRVKRLEIGDRVTLLTGRGTTALAEVADARRDFRVRLLSIDAAPPVTPAVDVLAATPKGPRLDDMIDALAQAGARSWRPLRTKLGVVDPREGKLARMERIAREASKQSLRAWDLALLEPVDFAAAIAPTSPGLLVIADRDARPYPRAGAAEIRLLIGPEGGWTPAELAQAREAGAVAASFGPHTMRIELAAAIACAIVLDIERRA